MKKITGLSVRPYHVDQVSLRLTSNQRRSCCPLAPASQKLVCQAASPKEQRPYRPSLVNELGRSLRHGLLAVVLILGVSWGHAAHADVGTILYASGDQLPLNNAGATAALDYPSITPFRSESGHVLFQAKITGQGISDLYANNEGIWLRYPSGQLSLVARKGSPAPGLPGITFGTVRLVNDSDYSTYNELRAPPLTEHGDVYFLAMLYGPGVTASNRESLWIYRDGTPVLIARQGDPVPGVSATFGIPKVLAWKSDGQHTRLLFESTISGPGVNGLGNYSLWKASSAAAGLELVAIGTTNLNAVPSVLTLAPKLAWNSRGDTLLYGALIGPGITTTIAPGNLANSQVIYRPNSTEVLVRAGMQVPGIPEVRFFANLHSDRAPPLMNSLGEVLFRAVLVDASGNATGTDIFKAVNGVITPVLRSGQAVPDQGLGAVVGSTVAGSSTIPPYSIADDGTVVTVAQLSGPGTTLVNDRAFLRIAPNGEVQTIVRGGQAPPGVASESGIAISNSSLGGYFSVNAHNDLAFYATLAGAVTTLNDLAVITYVNGTLRMVARKGDVVEDGEQWRISHISTPKRYFNDQGQLLFAADAVRDFGASPNASGVVRVDEFGNAQWLFNGHATPNVSGDTIVTSGYHPWMSISFPSTGDAILHKIMGPGSARGGNAIVNYHIEPIRGGVCRADFNGDGLSSEQDLFEFFTAWFSASLLADVNQSGSVTVEDIFSFLNAWFEGC